MVTGYQSETWEGRMTSGGLLVRPLSSLLLFWPPLGSWEVP